MNFPTGTDKGTIIKAELLKIRQTIPGLRLADVLSMNVHAAGSVMEAVKKHFLQKLLHQPGEMQLCQRRLFALARPWILRAVKVEHK